MIHFHVVTLFPELVASYADASILGRAQKGKKIKVSYYNPRDFTDDKNRRIDDRSYGGGPGMVMEALPILKAVAKATKGKKVDTYIFAPGGKLFDQKQAATIAKKSKDIVLICGRYEGIDARVKKILKAREISVGPYTLTGGEVPAMIVIDAVSRHLPGVLGNDASREEMRTASPELYTRPETFTYKGKKYTVPKVLLSGHHGQIEAWRGKKKGK